jgi:hypothetical protein
MVPAHGFSTDYGLQARGNRKNGAVKSSGRAISNGARGDSVDGVVVTKGRVY